MKKEWYKTWWGGIVVVATLPFFMIYFAWAKSGWNKWVKIGVTALSLLFTVHAFTNTKEEKTKEVARMEEQKTDPKQAVLEEEQRRKAEEIVKANTVTTEQAVECKIFAEKLILSVLKAPSTAEFPNMSDWGITKTNGVVTIASYVDSQNSFGAMLRSQFQIKYDEKTGKTTSFVFDGKEYLK